LVALPGLLALLLGQPVKPRKSITPENKFPMSEFHGSQPLPLGLNQGFFGESEPLAKNRQGEQFVASN
jgi:hypothetical protein